MPLKEEQSKTITLRRLEDRGALIEIVGETPLIPHRWSEKAKAMMAKKQSEPGVRVKRAPKDKEQEAYDSCYWLGDQPAMPAVAFKAAMVSACRFFEEPSMTLAKTLFYVTGQGPDQLIPIQADDRVMREDTPRNATGVADLRYRYAFFPWSCVLNVVYLPSMINAESVVALVDAAGRVGVGDWRPGSPKSSTGTFGQFRVKE